MLFLSLDFLRMCSLLTIFLTKVKIIFHVLILFLVCLENGYASGRLSYGKTSMYRPRHTHYVTIVVFVCPYIRTPLARGLFLGEALNQRSIQEDEIPGVRLPCLLFSCIVAINIPA